MQINRSLGALVALGTIPAAVTGTPSPEKNKPNIIIIVADDLGWADLGYNGSKIKTTNIDRFAGQGIRLSRFYVAPVSSPTRAGLLTGMYPDRFGTRENVIPPWRDFGLDPSNLLIPEFLANHGYRNRAILGKWHLGHSRQEYYPLRNGFTHFYGHLNGAIDYFTHERDGVLDWHNDYKSSYDKGYSTDLIAEEASDCIRRYSKEGPFFLYVAFNAPHIPLQAKREDLELYGFDETKPPFGRKNPGETSGQGNTRSQTYAAMVTCLDRGIGNILNALRESGEEDNTLVLFMSDNGADEGSGGGSGGPLRGHKFQEFDGGVLAPAIIRWPDGFKGGTVVGQLTGYIDIFPTICEIVDPGSKPSPFDGISILKVLKNNRKNISRHLYLGCGALVEDDIKIIRSGRNPKMELEHDVIFNLGSDPYEENDLSEKDPELKERLLQLVMKYDAIEPERVLPPYEEGREGFVAPAEWNLFPEMP